SDFLGYPGYVHPAHSSPYAIVCADLQIHAHVEQLNTDHCQEPVNGEQQNDKAHTHHHDHLHV
ncbi:MAG: hypothetical protein QG556_180, partial [Pseudomonadota bacterium]|nr:hypothetical protein [Pseudomonadota bacterium]